MDRPERGILSRFRDAGYATGYATRARNDGEWAVVDVDMLDFYIPPIPVPKWVTKANGIFSETAIAAGGNNGTDRAIWCGDPLSLSEAIRTGPEGWGSMKGSFMDSMIEATKEFMKVNVRGGRPFFSFMHLYTFHDNFERVAIDYFDKRLAMYLESLLTSPEFLNTIFIISGDHGMEIPLYPNCDRSHPALSILLPKQWRGDHEFEARFGPNVFEALEHNQHQLVTEFDIYATLRQILSPGDGGDWFGMREFGGSGVMYFVPPRQQSREAFASVPFGPGEAFSPRSLFEKMPVDRTCAEAGVANDTHCRLYGSLTERYRCDKNETIEVVDPRSQCACNLGKMMANMVTTKWNAKLFPPCSILHPRIVNEVIVDHRAISVRFELREGRPPLSFWTMASLPPRLIRTPIYMKDILGSLQYLKTTPIHRYFKYKQCTPLGINPMFCMCDPKQPRNSKVPLWVSRPFFVPKFPGMAEDLEQQSAAAIAIAKARGCQ